MFVLFVCVMFVVSSGIAAGQEPTSEQQIADAVAPLPASLRDGATVVLGHGDARTVLREGTNAMVCQADAPTSGFAVSCYHKAIDPLSSRVFELLAAGKSDDEIGATVGAEVKEEKLEVEAGRVVYAAWGPSRTSALPIMSVYVPNATAESTGLTTELNYYRPWLMWAGTPVAHIMLPGK